MAIIRPDPKRTFSDTDNPFQGVKIATVIRVDPLNMTADLAVLTGGNSRRMEVPLTQGGAGPRSFWGMVPEKGSLAIIGYRRKHANLQEAVILGYLPSAMRSGLRFDPYHVAGQDEVAAEEQQLFNELYGKPIRHKRLLLDEGDAGGMSSAGAEFALTRDVRFCNRGGDLIELRDDDRTLVTQALHSFASTSAGVEVAGAVRRRELFVPDEITAAGGRQLKTPKERYFGADVLQTAGAGDEKGGAYKLAGADGTLGPRVNAPADLPPVRFADGRRAHYVSIEPEGVFEEPDGAAYAFTERRVEIRHTTDLIQEVLGEIDGFTMDRPIPYITQVVGTVVGNDPWSSLGMRQYGKILKPVLFKDFDSDARSSFSLDEVTRSALNGDIEAVTMAGAYLFYLQPPKGVSTTPAALAISKQGKAFLSLPGSRVENQNTRNISLEALLEGAMKVRIGASKPDNISVHLTLDGGLHADIGSDSEGRALTLSFHSSVAQTYRGTPDSNDVALDTTLQGDEIRQLSGSTTESVGGSKTTQVNGRLQQEADRIVQLAFGGFSGQYGEENKTVAGKSQYNHALAVLENIASGGKVTTILLGGRAETVAAGAKVTNVGGGAMSINVAAGAYSVAVGTGAVSITTGAGAVAVSTALGAVAVSAAAGAVAITAGLAMNLSAAIAVSILSPQILLGGPLAILGVCRGTPTLPPGSPTLDFITSIPLQGSALVRSI